MTPDQIRRFEDRLTELDNILTYAENHHRALRRARMHGILIGMAIAVTVFSAAVALRIAIHDHWPLACDGTGSLTICALRLIGVAS